MKQYAKIYNVYTDTCDFVKIIGYDEETNSYKVEKIFTRNPLEKYWINVGNVECIYLVEDFDYITVLDRLMLLCTKYDKWNIRIKVKNGRIISIDEFIKIYSDFLFGELYISCEDSYERGIYVVSICACRDDKKYTKFLVNPKNEKER